MMYDKWGIGVGMEPPLHKKKRMRKKLLKKRLGGALYGLIMSLIKDEPCKPNLTA